MKINNEAFINILKNEYTLDDVYEAVKNENFKAFVLFVRDKHGLNERELGRWLMNYTAIEPQLIVKYGRFDDLWHVGGYKNLNYLIDEVNKGNKLAKKWMPRLNSGSKSRYAAKRLCNYYKLSEREYRKLIKVETVEHLLSEKRYGEIDYQVVPATAFHRHIKSFFKYDYDRFTNYLSTNSNDDPLNLNVYANDKYEIINDEILMEFLKPYIEEFK